MDCEDILVSDLFLVYVIDRIGNISVSLECTITRIVPQVDSGKILPHLR